MRTSARGVAADIGAVGPTRPASATPSPLKEPVRESLMGVTAYAGLMESASNSGITETPAARRKSRRFIGDTLPVFAPHPRDAIVLFGC